MSRFYASLRNSNDRIENPVPWSVSIVHVENGSPIEAAAVSGAINFSFGIQESDFARNDGSPVHASLKNLWIYYSEKSVCEENPECSPVDRLFRASIDAASPITAINLSKTDKRDELCTEQSINLNVGTFAAHAFSDLIQSRYGGKKKKKKNISLCLILVNR